MSGVKQTPVIEQLIGGQPLQRWAENGWPQTPVKIQTSTNTVCNNFDETDVMSLVQSAQCDRVPNLFVVRRGVIGSKEAVQAWAAQTVITWDGLLQALGDATLRVTGAPKYSQKCRDLLQAVFDGFGERASVNLYVSPSGGQTGLPIHYDDHEVFVIQIRGRKSWQFWRPKINARVTSFSDLKGPPPDPEVNDVDLKFEVGEGDVLYIPRGFWHRASAEHGQSIHLTCGVHVKRGVDVLSWVYDEALKSDRLRANLPLCPDGWDGDPLLEATEAALVELREILNAPDAAKRFLRARFRFEHERTFTFDGRT